jgi:macrolide-specific efflux system membrane fusion protein
MARLVTPGATDPRQVRFWEGIDMKLKVVALVVLAAVGVGALAVTFGGFGANAAASTQFLTAPATVGDVTDDVAATGSLASAESYGLLFGRDPYLVGDDDPAPTSEVTWPVTAVDVKVGDTVAEGDVLASADTTDLERQLATATADLRSANINLALAEDGLHDADDDDDDTDTDAELQAQLALYNAQNQVSQASSARGAIQAQIKAASLTAPIAGVVTEVNIRIGFDAPSSAAIVIASNMYQVTTDVVESDLAGIELGQTAAVTIDALETEVEGTVTAISPVAGDGSSGVVAFPVTVNLTEAPAGARAGMSAEVTITIASATGVLTVPSSALQGADGEYVVMTLGADGTPQRIPVEVGLVTSTTAEITSGLAEGTAVVTGTAADLIGTLNQGNGRFGAGGVAIPGNGGGGPRNVVIEDGQP